MVQVINEFIQCAPEHLGVESCNDELHREGRGHPHVNDGWPDVKRHVAHDEEHQRGQVDVEHRVAGATSERDAHLDLAELIHVLVHQGKVTYLLRQGTVDKKGN